MHTHTQSLCFLDTHKNIPQSNTFEHADGCWKPVNSVILNAKQKEGMDLINWILLALAERKM